MRAVLHNGQERTVLADGVTSFGRDGRVCDVYVPDDDLLSRRHALFVGGPGLPWKVIDTNSSNGTLVNGRRVLVRQLEPGDSLEMGRQRLVFGELERVEHLAVPGGAAFSQAPPVGRFVRRLGEAGLAEALAPERVRKSSFDRLLALQVAGRRALSAAQEPGAPATLAGLARALVAADRAHLVVPAPRGLRVVAWVDDAGPHETRSLVPFSREMAEDAATRGLAVLARNLPQDRRYGRPGARATYNVGPALCAPLPLGPEPAPQAWLYLENQVESFPFEEEDRLALERFTVAVGAALRRARPEAIFGDPDPCRPPPDP